MTDVDIKKDMYKEFENKDNIINIKEELLKSMNNLKDEELIHSNNFRLEDTMSAFVINHFKMDPHCHNEKISLINDNNKKLEKLFSFSYNDTLYTIFDIFKKEISLFYNVPIHTVFLENTLAFITEENINIDNFTDLSKINYNITTSFILSFKYLIYLLFHSISKTSCLRDEDLPSFLYSNSKKLNKPQSNEFLEKIIKILEEEGKKDDKNKNLIEQIITIVKLQKGIIKILLIFFNSNNDKENKEKEEKKEIKLTKNNYDKIINEIIEETNKINFDIYPKEIEQNKNIYQKEIYKLMPVLGSCKKSHIFEEKECFDKLKELLNDFKEIRRIFSTTNLYHLYKLIHNINHRAEINSPSFIIRHIIEINILNEDNNLFGNKATKKVFKSLFNEYEISINLTNNEKDKEKNNDNELLNQIINLYQDILKYELKNKARKIREARELINNIVGLVIFIYKKEKEINEQNQNSHQKNTKDLLKTFVKNFVVFNLLKIMLSVLFNCFYIDFFKFYELDYIFFICEEISNQVLKHIILFAKNIDKNNEILSENNIANSDKKKGFKDEKKVIFDEIYIYNSYKCAFQGMKLLLYYIKENKLIKMPVLREEDIAMRINNRIPFFKHCSMIINISYEQFINDYNENKNLLENEDYIDSAKEFLQMSKKHLGELIKADQHLRDIFMNGNDELTQTSKVIISNSLLFNKIKKFKEERKENEYLKFNINLNKYNSKFPLLEILK